MLIAGRINDARFRGRYVSVMMVIVVDSLEICSGDPGRPDDDETKPADLVGVVGSSFSIRDTVVLAATGGDDDPPVIRVANLHGNVAGAGDPAA